MPSKLAASYAERRKHAYTIGSKQQASSHHQETQSRAGKEKRVTVELKCLEKDPARRYGSALDLADDLHRFLNNEPIAARPSSVLNRCVKFARRNKGLVGATLSVMIALLAGTIASLTFALREGQQRQSALEQAGKADTSRRAALREAYQARLGAALATLGDRDFSEAAVHLEAAPESLRGWEWQHLHRRLLDESPVVTRLHQDHSEVKALLPGGRHVLTQARPGGVFQLVDAVKGVVLHELPAGKFAWVGQTTAGPLVVIYRPGEPLFLMDIGGEVHRTDVSFGPEYMALAVSRDGKLLASASRSPGVEGRLEFRDLPSGKLRRAGPGLGPFTGKAWGQDPPSGRMAFSQDAKWLAAACGDEAVRLFDVEKTAAPVVCRGHKGIVIGVTFHPDGQSFLSWGDDGTLRQWRVPDGQPLDVRRGHNRIIYDAVFSEDGQQILSGSEDRTVRLWAQLAATRSPCCAAIRSA